MSASPSDANTPAVELQSIAKRYGSSRIFEGLDLRLETGVFYGLLGRNGAGKSTLLRILARQETPDSGTGRVLGVALEEDSPLLNRSIGYVSETVEYHVPLKLGRLFRSFRSFYPDWDQALFDEISAEFGVPLGKRFTELSRGQKMQAVLCAALAIRPRLLLLDEITSVLDARIRSLLMARLGAFARGGGTVLLATNLVSEIHAVADRLVLVDHGRVEMDLPLEDIASRFTKVRRAGQAPHAVFEDPSLVEIGLNSDRSVSYILPREMAARYSLGEGLLDRRMVTAEDAFIYFTKRTEPAEPPR